MANQSPWGVYAPNIPFGQPPTPGEQPFATQQYPTQQYPTQQYPVQQLYQGIPVQNYPTIGITQYPAQTLPQAGPPQAALPQAGPPQAVPPQAALPQAGPPQAGPPQAVLPQAVPPQPYVQSYTNLTSYSTPQSTDQSPASYATQQYQILSQQGLVQNYQQQQQQFSTSEIVRKRKTPYGASEDEDANSESIDDYLKSMERSMPTKPAVTSGHIANKPQASLVPETPLSIQDRLTALAQAKKDVSEEAENPALHSPAAMKQKVVTQQLDPALFQKRKKSRFDQQPTSSPFATGANAIPVGKTPTLVLNKFSISSSPKVTAQKGGPKRKQGPAATIPENTCELDIKIQRVIMQQVIGMIEFKFTIGINKMYKGIWKNQKNKKKHDPLKLKKEFDIETLVTYCESMTHLIRVKKKRFIKLLPHLSLYIRAGVNLWAMFHGRGTRRLIRDNWDFWIGSKAPTKLGLDWDFYFQLVRTCYLSCNKRQRSKYRSKYKGIERYILENVMWATNKSVKTEKLWKELKCEFAIKKPIQMFVQWKKVIKTAVRRMKFLVVEPGDVVSFQPSLRNMLVRVEMYITSQQEDVTFNTVDVFEANLKKYCENQIGYTWHKWDISFRTLIKLYNCMNSSIHRPVVTSKLNTVPDVRIAFSKIFRTGFKPFLLPLQDTRLGEGTVPAMIKREKVKIVRRKEKLSQKKLAAATAAEEVKRKAEEEMKQAEEEKIQAEKEKIKEEEDKVPTNDEFLMKLVVAQPTNPQETVKDTVEETPPLNPPVITEVSDVSEDDDETFDFDPIYTYRRYVQPIAIDTLYVIPDGTRLEDEIKLRVENQPLTPGQGYGIALSDTENSVLFVFYPYGRTMRSSHFSKGKHHHRVFGDFMAARCKLFQLTIKIKRNRFEVFTDDLCIKTVPAFMDTIGIKTAMCTGDVMPFVNFRVRSVIPEVPRLPYLLRRRHQKGLLVTIHRHPQLGIITKIGKVSGNIQTFVSHLQDLLNIPPDSDEPHVNKCVTPSNALSTPRNNLVTPSDILETPSNTFETSSNTLVTPSDTLVTPSDTLVTPSDTLVTPSNNMVTLSDTLVTPINVPTATLGNITITNDTVVTSFDTVVLPNGAQLTPGDTKVTPKPIIPRISVVNRKCIWVTGHHKHIILVWLKHLGF